MARRLTTLALLTLATAAVVAASGWARGDESVDLGTAKGLNYRVTPFENFAGAGFSSFASCAEGAAAVSGGVDIVASGAEGRMGETKPILGDDFRRRHGSEGATGWRTSASDLSGGPKDINFFAVCKASGAGGIKYRRLKRSYDPGEEKTVKARCPDGYRVIGGGLESPNPVVVATAPFDAGDQDQKPDDGWRVRAVNAFGLEQTLRAHAVCRKAGAWDLSYESENVAITGGTTLPASATCPSGGAITGGGAKVKPGPGSGRVFEMYPAGGTPPREDWHVGITNPSMPQITATVYAICRV